ncbi:hypothetical protein AaE_014306 [Aphanomyces astaci]|uniref:Myb-like domain-containing protein n=1 Tax=Aphanomyces astaci TaxID=112090 RepID=A0A397B8J0_APHAT|nr:hypothetical protein AaE_014306 [Aphanomyces astaci]RHY16686.1 hypothetical protein DYB36_011618 [Aphanomyces astaci]
MWQAVKLSKFTASCTLSVNPNSQGMSEEGSEGVEVHEKKWWTEEEDKILLTQINNTRPFLQRKDTRKAWDTMAATLKDVDGFTRPGIDGKKAQNRFLLLVRQHKSNNNEAARLSGATEDETPKSRLLDDLVPLYNDAATKKRAATPLSEADEKAASIKFIREQAMLRGKRKSLESSDGSDVGGLSKKKLILEAQDKEVELEKERLAFKKLKFEREMEEREKDRAERELERQERQQIRDIESRRNDEMMRIIRHFIDKA